MVGKTTLLGYFTLPRNGSQYFTFTGWFNGSRVVSIIFTCMFLQAREVQRVFPGLPSTSILEDLQSTHSVEITIDNILEGRLIILVGFL